MDRLIENIKTKMTLSSRTQKIQLLTLVPTSWRYCDIVKEFPVTDFMVRQSRKLLSEEGILASPKPRKGRELSEEIKILVKEFFCDDECSRLMPGKKDYVSISKNNHKQK